MTRYRLPEALGGGEYEEYRNTNGGTEAPAGTVAFLEGGCIFAVARGLLTEVKDPLPPEPSALGWYEATIGNGEFILDHQTAGWYDMYGRTMHSTWANLHEGFPNIRVKRLVPDPFAKPVELPWDPHHNEPPNVSRTHVYVMSDGDIHDTISVGSLGATVVLTAEGAREKARALWAAADAAEQNAELPEWERELLEGGAS